MRTLLLLLAIVHAFARAEAPQPDPAQVPLRYGKVRGTISKYVLTVGGYTNAAEKVCEFETEIPIYGAFEKGKFARQIDIARCETVVKGVPHKVQFKGSVYPGGPNGESKTVGVQLFIFAAGEGHEGYLTQIGGAAGAADARTISLFLYGTSYEKAGAPERPETYAVELTFTDSL